MTANLYPGLPLLVALVLMPLLGTSGRRVLSLLAPAVGLLLLGISDLDARWSFQMAQHEWVIWQSDALSRVFALAFMIYALITGFYAWTEVGRGPKTASMGLAAGGVGVALAGDLLSLYFFWEMLTVASVFTIWFGGTRESIRAGFHYVLFHLFGGICLLAGILMHLGQGGQGLEPPEPGSAASWLMLLGLMINAAVPPLHAWLSDAYPRASIYGTVFLAAYTTKSAVYALARLYPGTEVLIWAGAAMTLYGVVFAVMENNIRRLLAYHIVSQVGFMVCGVGIGSALSINGSSAHAFAHIFYKGLLMMSAGAVIHATGRERLSDLGRLAGPMRWTLLFFAIGAFSISGLPLLNGFVSKSMVISAAAKAHLPIIEAMLLTASMGTFLSIGLKLLWFTFFGKDQGAQVERPVPLSMNIAMGLAAGLCVATGLVPALLYSLLPTSAEYHPYTASHVIQSLQLLVGTTLGFWILRNKLWSKPKITLDTDRLYRVPLAWAVPRIVSACQGVGRRTESGVGLSILGVGGFLRATYDRFQTSALAAQMAIVWTVLFAVLLFAFLS